MDPAPWWKKGVIYQIYPRSFADADGDGTGDLRGITAHLDYLNDGTPSSLGVDAIWLSPFFLSPGCDFGYDVSDYCAVDPLFGTMADFDALVREAHRRGIRVILDLVLNHTSHLHPWFARSRASRTNPKRDWYLWRDAGRGRFGQRVPPNNWQSVFGGKAWQWDDATGQYYYHMFLREQPDLNWRNPAVRKAAMDVFRFWLDRGVDGFRLDVVDAYFKDAQLRSNPPAPGIRGYDRQQHLYDRCQPELADAYAEIRRVLESYGDRMAVGEAMGGAREAAGYVRSGKLPLAFNFDFTHQPWAAAAFQREILRYEEMLGEDGWPCYVLSNHDVSRHASRYGGSDPAARAKVAAAMLLTLRGTPFLYYGEELGMRDGRIRRAEIQDPPGKRYWPFYGGRDPERTPMPWTGGPGFGFTSGRPWLPFNPENGAVNATAQTSDPDSVLSFYRKLIWLRKKSPALTEGSFRSLIREPRDGLAYLRETKRQTILIALNFAGVETDLWLDEPLSGGPWKAVLSNLPESTGPNAAPANPASIRLQPYEASIFTRGAPLR